MYYNLSDLQNKGQVDAYESKIVVVVDQYCANQKSLAVTIVFNGNNRWLTNNSSV